MDRHNGIKPGNRIKAGTATGNFPNTRKTEQTSLAVSIPDVVMVP